VSSVNWTGPAFQRKLAISQTGGATLAVPEPSTRAMMLFGFGLLGFAAMRKAKRKALPA
jgi:hypothetical protein